MSDTTNTTNALALVPTKEEFVLKVGKSTRNIHVTTAIAIGHKEAMLNMQNVAFLAAFENAKHGRYRGAAEIMGFAAPAALTKTLAPQNGQWNKALLGAYAAVILGRTAPAKGWPAKARVGRLMAQLVNDMVEAKPVPPVTPPTDVTGDMPQADPLANPS